MFGWIPILGPIIDGIVSIFTKKMDTDVEKYRVDGKVDVAAFTASAQTLRDFKDDIGVRLARDIIIFPGAIYCGLGFWDKIVEHRYPELVWVVSNFDDMSDLKLLPLAVITFLLGMSFKSWFRK